MQQTLVSFGVLLLGSIISSIPAAPVVAEDKDAASIYDFTMNFNFSPNTGAYPAIFVPTVIAQKAS